MERYSIQDYGFFLFLRVFTPIQIQELSEMHWWAEFTQNWEISVMSKVMSSKWWTCAGVCMIRALMITCSVKFPWRSSMLARSFPQVPTLWWVPWIQCRCSVSLSMCSSPSLLLAVEMQIIEQHSLRSWQNFTWVLLLWMGGEGRKQHAARRMGRSTIVLLKISYHNLMIYSWPWLLMFQGWIRLSIG